MCYASFIQVWIVQLCLEKEFPLKIRSRERKVIMKKTFAFAAAVLVMAFAVKADDLATAEPAATVSPIQVALFSPTELPSPDTDIRGLRLSFIYGRCRNLSGIDLGIANHCRGRLAGFELGGFSMVTGNTSGVQINLCASITLREMRGFQCASYTSCRDVGRGMQLGVINHCNDMRGFQLGLLNVSREMTGVQIGLINIISESPLTVFPILNAHF